MSSNDKPYRILDTNKSNGKSGYAGAFGEVWKFATAAEAQKQIDGMRRNLSGRNFEHDLKVVKV